MWVLIKKRPGGVEGRHGGSESSPALPVLGGLCGAPGDTLRCRVLWGGDSMVVSVSEELAARDGDTRELPGLL